MEMRDYLTSFPSSPKSKLDEDREAWKPSPASLSLEPNHLATRPHPPAPPHPHIPTPSCGVSLAPVIEPVEPGHGTGSSLGCGAKLCSVLPFAFYAPGKKQQRKNMPSSESQFPLKPMGPKLAGAIENDNQSTWGHEPVLGIPE